VLRSATAADAADNFKKQAVDAADTWKKQATETADTLKKQATDTASKVKATAAQTASQAADAVKNLKVPDMAQLDVDIKKTVIWNFLVQLVLTAVSWGIAFLTSHTSLAKVCFMWDDCCSCEVHVAAFLSRAHEKWVMLRIAIMMATLQEASCNHVIVVYPAL